MICRVLLRQAGRCLLRFHQDSEIANWLLTLSTEPSQLKTTLSPDELNIESRAPEEILSGWSASRKQFSPKLALSRAAVETITYIGALAPSCQISKIGQPRAANIFQPQCSAANGCFLRQRMLLALLPGAREQKDEPD